MFRILYWFLLDAFFIYVLVDTWGQMGGYVILVLAFIAFFTWELIHSFLEWLK